jgi:hypothetical protein
MHCAGRLPGICAAAKLAPLCQHRKSSVLQPSQGGHPGSSKVGESTGRTALEGGVEANFVIKGNHCWCFTMARMGGAEAVTLLPGLRSLADDAFYS